MAKTKETINEGQNYTFTLNTSLNTSGGTIKTFVFEYGNSSDTGTEVGSASGANASTDIDIACDFKTPDLKQNTDYVFEVWLDPDTSDSRLLFPDEGDTYILHVQDRRQFQ